MATVTELRDRIAVVVQPLGLHVEKWPAESPPSALPAVVIGEPTATFGEGETARGLDSWEFPLLLLVSAADYQTAQAELDTYLGRQGDRSVRQVFADSPSLGLVDGTSAYIDRMDEYGPRPAGDIQLAGAVLRLVVRTSG